MKYFIWFFAVLLASAIASAAENVSKETAIEFLQLSRMEQTIDASIKEYEAQLHQNAAPEIKKQIHQLMVGTMSWAATKDDLAAVVIRLYTKEEIEAAMAFMKTPLGASFTAKSEAFAREYAAIISARMNRVIEECCIQKK
ncbi:MAG: DUF2059 domain-containing protein [Nitrospira defluvii]|nr:DUF2059 domain-containing protein [Nitrospira defluvii]